MTSAMLFATFLNMKTLFSIFILVSLGACSNLRSKESCTDSAGWNYQPNNDEEQDYKNLSDRCKVQHGIKIDREKYLKFRQEKATETLKEGCTCESGFTGQSAHQHPNDPRQKEWAEECQKIGMEKEYLRGIELANTPPAKKQTKEEMQKTQSISPDTAQLFCKKS